MSRRLAALCRNHHAVVEDDAFIRATAPKGGRLARYELWNIDPASVVSFAALAFGHGEVASRGKGGV